MQSSVIHQERKIRIFFYPYVRQSLSKKLGSPIQYSISSIHQSKEILFFLFQERKNIFTAKEKEREKNK